MTGRDPDGHVCFFGIGNTCVPSHAPSPPPPPDPAHTASGSSSPSSNAPTKPSLVHGGVGFQGGAEGAAGLGKGGILTENVGAGVFVGGKDAVSAGTYEENAAAESVTSTPKGTPAQPKDSPTVVGAGISAGAGVFVTNASSASQLSGPFNTMGASVSAGEIGLGVQISVGKDSSGNGIWQVGISYSPGLGAYGYEVTTNTTTKSTDSQ